MSRSGGNTPPFDAIEVSPREEIERVAEIAETCNLPPDDPIAGSSMLGSSAKSADLTICTNSPIPCDKLQETPDYFRRNSRRIQIAPIELFSDMTPDGVKDDPGLAARIPEPAPEVQPLDQNDALEASIELGVIPEARNSLLNINAGGIEDSLVCGSIDFQRDNFYSGGYTIATDAPVGDGKGLELYQTARIGNFSYNFSNLEPGEYLVDLHLAEIVFTDGPPGLRIFDVFIQDEQVVSRVDIYAKVGSNQPLILSDLQASITGEEGLSIRFEGVVGKPIVCGISIRIDSSAGKRIQRRVAGNIMLVSRTENEISSMREFEIRNDKCSGCWKLKQQYDLLYKEQVEVKRAMEDVKLENEAKSRECHEAWMSLQELQMELMRKSMHVGSLAFAVEGQVKEKSRWNLCLGDLSRKFRLLKLEHIKLSEEAVEYKRCFATMNHMTATIKSTLDHHANLEREFKDLKLKFTDEAKERKDLYNKIVELKGNIRVFCRCRPLNEEEIAGGASMAVDFESEKDDELTIKSHGAPKKVFKFDSAFSPEENQERVFEKTSPLATSVLDGYNVCIFAYGQTGTGKTFTMEGTEEARGVNYRTLEELFRIIRERQGLIRYDITVSVLEVYNEQIHDLLLSGSQPGAASKRLEVRQVAEGAHHVPGLVEAHVSNMSEVWEVLQTGSKARAVGSTNANEHSSRSHCIHCVMVRGENLMNGECTRSKLWLIDLAGSERVAKTDAQGERLKEAQSINKSLSALGDVISALATKSTHIPFRNSKLTHLLQDSLGGDSKTLMFVQISPNENDVSETLCSLNFASRVRGIELGPAKKHVDGSEVLKYKQMVEKVKQDSKNKDGQIKKMEETIQSLELKNRSKDLINKNLQDKVKELESQLLIERKLARQHVDNKIAENQLHQQQKQQEPSNSLVDHQPIIRPLLEKTYNHPEEQLPPFKELVCVMQPLVENNISNNGISRHGLHPLLKDKENIPELAEEALPRKASRVSLCATARRPAPVIPAPRRNSLIPIPALKSAVLPPFSLLNNTTAIADHSPPLPSTLPGIVEIRDGRWEGETKNHEPRSTKKFASIMRRSLQKKVIIRSPLPQSIRRGGAFGGSEKVRGSVGGSGRKARRVLAGDGAKGGDRMVQQKRQQEKGWNHGTAVRNNY